MLTRRLSQRDVHTKDRPKAFKGEVRIPTVAVAALQQVVACHRPSETFDAVGNNDSQPCLSSGTTASDMRTRLLGSNNSSEISQLRSTLEMRFLATLAPSVFCNRRRESRYGAI